MAVDPKKDDTSPDKHPTEMTDVVRRHRHGVDIPEDLFKPQPKIDKDGDKNLYYCFVCAQFAPVKVEYDEIVDETPAGEGEEKMDELRMSVLEDRLCVHCDGVICRKLRPDLNSTVEVKAQDKLTKTGERMVNAAAEYKTDRMGSSPQDLSKPSS